MLCKKPFRKEGMSFGCGQCLPCRISKRRIWTHRLMLEACVHDRASFLTLTFDDKKIEKREVEDHASVSVRELQLWLKRFRNAYGAFRYFAVGEYGDKSLRPHYHVALFGRDLRDFSYNRYKYATGTLGKTWEYGNLHIGDLNLDSAQYICGYTVKKLTKVGDDRLGGRHPEFARMSLRPGIGYPALPRLAAALQNTAGERYIERTGDVPEVLRHERRKLPLGRYMRQGLRAALGHEFVREPIGVALAKTAKMQAMYQDYVDAEGTASVTGFIQYKEEREKQKIVQMEVKHRIFTGGKI